MKFKLKRKIALLVVGVFILLAFYNIWWPENKRNPIILVYRGLEDILDTNPPLLINSWGSCDSFKGGNRQREEESIPYLDDLEIFRETTPFVGDVESDFESIQKSDQVKELKRSLESIIGKTVLLIFSDREYTIVYLNWISHLVVNLNGMNVLKYHLFIALDTESCRFCRKIPVNCFCIHPSKFLSQLHLKNPSMNRRFSSEIWTIRMNLIWLMSYWGYDLLLMDADAIPNSAEFVEYFTGFKEDHLVASIGFYPRSVVNEWGRTICMGVVLIRSLRDSDGMCSLFRALRHSQVADDQIAYTTALYSMNFSFQAEDSEGVISNVDPRTVLTDHEFLRGTSAVGGLRMTILPNSIVCRTNCTFFQTHSDKLQAIHSFKEISISQMKNVFSQLEKLKIPGPLDVKMTAMKELEIWYLRPGIENYFENFKGVWKDPKLFFSSFLKQ